MPLHRKRNGFPALILGQMQLGRAAILLERWCRCKRIVRDALRRHGVCMPTEHGCRKPVLQTDFRR
jgi:hypothetical protein